MQTNNQFSVDSHIIEVNKESFGFSITHKFHGKVVYTASYERSTDAMRMASSIGSFHESQGHEVFLLVNTHLETLNRQ